MSRAKTTHHLPRLVRSGGKRRKFIALVIVAILLALVIRDPQGSASTVTYVVDGLVTFVDALAD